MHRAIGSSDCLNLPTNKSPALSNKNKNREPTAGNVGRPKLLAVPVFLWFSLWRRLLKRTVYFLPTIKSYKEKRPARIIKRTRVFICYLWWYLFVDYGFDLGKAAECQARRSFQALGLGCYCIYRHRSEPTPRRPPKIFPGWRMDLYIVIRSNNPKNL